MQIGKTTFFSQNILPEKEREHQKGAKIQANIIFGLRVRERKRRREWKEILLRNKKTMAGRWVRYQRLYRRSSSTYSLSQLLSEETNKANSFYLMLLMARIVIGVVWGSVGKHIRQLAIEYLPEAPLAPCLDHPPTFRWGGRWWRNDGNGSKIVTRCHWIFCED